MQRDDDASTRLSYTLPPLPNADGEDCLVVIFAGSQAEVGTRHVLKTPLTTIGRSQHNDIVISSDAVSRHHAEIARRGARHRGPGPRLDQRHFHQR